MVSDPKSSVLCSTVRGKESPASLPFAGSVRKHLMEVLLFETGLRDGISGGRGTDILGDENSMKRYQYSISGAQFVAEKRLGR